MLDPFRTVDERPVMLPQREPAESPVMTRVDGDDTVIELTTRESTARGDVTGAVEIQRFIHADPLAVACVDVPLTLFVPDWISVHYMERLTTQGLRWRVNGITLGAGRRTHAVYELDSADLPAYALEFALDAQPDPHGYAIHRPGCRHCAG